MAVCQLAAGKGEQGDNENSNADKGSSCGWSSALLSPRCLYILLLLQKGWPCCSWAVPGLGHCLGTWAH